MENIDNLPDDAKPGDRITLYFLEGKPFSAYYINSCRRQFLNESGEVEFSRSYPPETPARLTLCLTDREFLGRDVVGYEISKRANKSE